jgi:nucleoside-diphosphate-sugar epimerase
MVLHLAPPPGQGANDTRTRHLVQALARGGRVSRLVYASTSGVYGDCAGARFDETRAVAPAPTVRGAASMPKACLRWFGRRAGVAVSILRMPGHLRQRPPGGHPRERLRRGHAGAACRRRRAHQPHPRRRPGAGLRGGVAARQATTRAARQRRHRAAHGRATSTWQPTCAACRARRASAAPRRCARPVVGPMQLSFMSESRRLDNRD